MSDSSPVSAVELGIEAFSGWADAAPALLWITDAEGRCVYVNRRWCEVTGQAPAAALGWGWAEAVHPDDRERVTQEFERAAALGQPCRIEYRVRHAPTGGYRWMIDAAEPRRDEHGRLLGYVGTVMDLTDRKIAELDAARSRQELQRRFIELETFLEAAPVGFALFDRAGRYVRVNAAVGRFHGRPTHDYPGLTPRGIHCEIADEVEAGVAEVLATGRPVLNVEMRRAGRGPAGSPGVWLVGFFPVPDPEGGVAGVGAVLQNLTELTRLRDELVQAQKLESIGRLAGGVAHDFNNLLTVIAGYAQQAAERLGPASPAAGDLTQIRAAADRGAAFTRHLLSFARRQVVEPRAVDLAELVESNEELVRRLMGGAITLEIERPGRPVPVLIDPGQAAQILLNLAANARDAMPGGGLLRMTVDTVTLGPDDVPAGENLKPGPFARLRVTDTGIGMSETVRRRVFEPFFTTKESGRGIGLASCHGIIKQAGGLIGVESRPGGGTTFTIHLPLTAKPSEHPTVPAPAGRAGANETVLLVEDEPMVREMLTQALRQSGYLVTDAGSPEQAMRLAMEAARPFDLVVTDVVMPGGNGVELAEAIVEAKPASRVLLMSGYLGSVGEPRPPYRMISKPFDLDRFLGEVRAVLDAAPARG